MEEFFSSGAAVDVALFVLVIEVGVLTFATKPGGRRRRLIDLGFAAAPGACLLLALRAALTGGGWMPVAFWLAASFPMHVADLLRRRA